MKFQQVATPFSPKAADLTDMENLLQRQGQNLPEIDPNLDEKTRHIHLLNYLLKEATNRIRELEEKLNAKSF